LGEATRGSRKFQFKYGTEPVKPDMIHLLLSNSQIYKLSTPAVRDKVPSPKGARAAQLNRQDALAVSARS
jgi:hypothetical protein